MQHNSAYVCVKTDQPEDQYEVSTIPLETLRVHLLNCQKHLMPVRADKGTQIPCWWVGNTYQSVIPTAGQRHHMHLIAYLG